jgi:hypothetical protein
MCDDKAEREMFEAGRAQGWKDAADAVETMARRVATVTLPVGAKRENTNSDFVAGVMRVIADRLRGRVTE